VFVGPYPFQSIVALGPGSLNMLDGDGNVLQTLRCGRWPVSVAFSTDGERFVLSHEYGLTFYQRDSGLMTHFRRKNLPGSQLCTVAMRPDGERVLAWRDNGLLVFDGTGSLLTEIRFAKRIGPPVFDVGDDIYVAAGSLIRLRVNS
jgi:hypothetical protein